MAKVHFLNVGDGDCSIIEHDSLRNTMIDINKGGTLSESTSLSLSEKSVERGVQGNFNQKASPTDPLKFMSEKSIKSLFRFILTHPDMDHMGGLSKLMSSFNVFNFWDTKNKKVIDADSWADSIYSEDDWKTYQTIREGNYPGITYLCLTSGATGSFYNKGQDSGDLGDGLFILSPTTELIEASDQNGNYNDCSYVILFISNGFKMIFAGDSEDQSWEHILGSWGAVVNDVDILVAPHHGRDSGRKWDFLDALKPRLVLIGNAPSKHIAYDKYRKYGETITNNQAGDISLVFDSGEVSIYVSNETYAKKFQHSFYSSIEKSHYIGCLTKSGLLLEHVEHVCTDNFLGY